MRCYEQEQGSGEGECAEQTADKPEPSRRGHCKQKDRGAKQSESEGAKRKFKDTVDRKQEEKEAGGTRENETGTKALDYEEQNAGRDQDDDAVRKVGRADGSEGVAGGAEGDADDAGEEAHGTDWPRATSAWRMPRAEVLRGSRCRACPTSSAEAASALRCSSMRASTR